MIKQRPIIDTTSTSKYVFRFKDGSFVIVKLNNDSAAETIKRINQILTSPSMNGKVGFIVVDDTFTFSGDDLLHITKNESKPTAKTICGNTYGNDTLHLPDQLDNSIHHEDDDDDDDCEEDKENVPPRRPVGRPRKMGSQSGRFKE